MAKSHAQEQVIQRIQDAQEHRISQCNTARVMKELDIGFCGLATSQ